MAESVNNNDGNQTSNGGIISVNNSARRSDVAPQVGQQNVHVDEVDQY